MIRNLLMARGVNEAKLVATLNDPNAYGTGVDDRFGYSVAVSDSYILVGAPTESDAGGSYSGKAYIFSLATKQLLFTLNNPNIHGTSANDAFGVSVAISGSYAIVSAQSEEDASNDYSGKAYIYNITTGQLLFSLSNPNPYGTSLFDHFGSPVAVSGNYAIVGAWAEDDAGGDGAGKAYIYNVATGQLLFTLNDPNAYGTSASDQFGNAVSVSGNYAIVGAPTESDAGGSYSGKAYIYNVTTGQLLFTLNNPNAYSTSANDRFGVKVAISGNYAAVSANMEDDASGTDSGKVYVYNVTNGQLLFTLNNPNTYGTSAGDSFGYDIAISGSYILVGAYTEDDAGGTDSGKVYIFDVTTGQLLFTLNNPNAYGASTSDKFGSSVAVSGDYIVVGAWAEDDAGGTDAGKVYIYQIT